jgi:preprotein translocase subunit YajC
MRGRHFFAMSHIIFTFLAQTAAPAATPAGGFNPGSLFPLIPIGIIFYFLVIRPQSKRQKDQEAMIKSIKTGDKVVTTGGIHGMVSNVKETTLIVKIADNVKIELDKSQVGSIKRDQPETASAS